MGDTFWTALGASSPTALVTAIGIYTIRRFEALSLRNPSAKLRVSPREIFLRFLASLGMTGPLARRNIVVEWSDGADRTSNDADVSIAPSKIPYSGFSPVRLQGQHVR
jgi:hypothetical protein